MKTRRPALVPDPEKSALQETEYLLSIPGMKESILEGMKTPLEDCVERIDWQLEDRPAADP
jgi:antitoxin YefM